MGMNWSSYSAFFAMGGYAFYVWGSVAACAIAVAAELVGLRGRRAAIDRVIRRQTFASLVAATEGAP
jgi:heme exporter protein D